MLPINIKQVLEYNEVRIFYFDYSILLIFLEL